MSIDQSKVVSNARTETQIVRKARRYKDALHLPARRVEVHLNIRPARVRRPVQVTVAASRHCCVCSVGGGFGHRDDRTVIHDEVAPYFLESVNEVRGWCRRVDREVCSQVSAMVRRGDGILVFPTLFAGSGECFCEPVPRTGICDLAVKIVCALFLTCGEFGLVQSRGPPITKGIE